MQKPISQRVLEIWEQSANPNLLINNKVFLEQIKKDNQVVRDKIKNGNNKNTN